MNFQLPDIQYFKKRKQEIKLFDTPNMTNAELNGQEDRTLYDFYEQYTHYEYILRDTFQIKINNLREKYDNFFSSSQKEDNYQKIIDLASQEEIKIKNTYQDHINAYRQGLLNGTNNEENNNLPFFKKTKPTHTELIFCFDASFGMYHPSLFIAVNKFLNILNSIKLDGVKIAIITYGGYTNTISEFTSNLTKLLLNASLILPASGLNIIFDNFKFTSVSDNNLSKALEKSHMMFMNSSNANKAINRHLVILSDGNLSGVVGSDNEYYGICKKSRYSDELENSVLAKEKLEKKNIQISSISLHNDNANIIKEISKIIFWEGNVKKINLDESSDKDINHQNSIIDLGKWEVLHRTMPKLNLYFTSQNIYTKEKHV